MSRFFHRISHCSRRSHIHAASACLSSILAPILASIIFLIPGLAFGSFGVTYQGRLLKPDRTPEQDSAIQFKLQIISPGSGACVMYDELKTIDMSSSSGLFSFTLNDGTGTREDTPTYPFDQIFNNSTSFTFGSGVCASGTTYAPSLADGRVLQVSFKDSTMSSWETIPALSLNYVPLAIQAAQIGGFGISNLMRVQESNGTLDSVSPLNNAQYTQLLALLAGTSSQYMQNGTTGATLPVKTSAPVGATAGDIWFDSTTHQIEFNDGTTTQAIGAGSGTVTSVTASSPLSSSGGTTPDIALSAQTAATILAGPASGTAANPTFRALVSTDLPVTGATGVYLNGGNSFGTAATLGTTDSNALTLQTVGSPRITINTSGGVGIGTTSPSEKLEVNGNVKTVHLVGSGAAPVVTAGTGSGTSPTVFAGGGTDVAGEITLQTGTAPATNGIIATLTFNAAYATAPYCVISPAFALATTHLTRVMVTTTTTAMTLTDVTTALSATSVYMWTYHCTQ